MSRHSNSPSSGARASNTNNNTLPPAISPESSFQRRKAVHGNVGSGANGTLEGPLPRPGEGTKTERIDVRRLESPERGPRRQASQPTVAEPMPGAQPVWGTARDILSGNATDNGVTPPVIPRRAMATSQKGSPLAHSSEQDRGRKRGRESIVDPGSTTSRSPDRSSRSYDPARPSQGSLRTYSPSPLGSARQPLLAPINDENVFSSLDPYALEVAARLKDTSASDNPRRKDSDNASLGGKRKIDKPHSPAPSVRAESVRSSSPSSIQTGSVGSTTTTSSSTQQQRDSKFKEGTVSTRKPSPTLEDVVVKAPRKWFVMRKANKSHDQEKAGQSPPRRTQSEDRPATQDDSKKSGRLNLKVVNAAGFAGLRVRLDGRTRFERERDEWEEKQMRDAPWRLDGI